MEEFGFRKYYDVRHRNTIADLIKPGKRCGIYLLKFDKDEYYIGQAIDVVRRFHQHKQKHDDIIGLSFQQTAKEELNSLEAELIGKSERKNILLRNISLTSVPPSESDLDLVVAKEQQKLWIEGHDIPDSKNRTDDENQRRKYAKKFAALQRSSSFFKVIPFLKKYIEKTIICPNKTERSFWALSCLPFSANNLKILLRLNIYKQEVLTVGEDERSIYYSFHLTDSTFNCLSENDVKQRYFNEFPTFSINNHFYKSGGADQINIMLQDGNEAISILDDPYFVLAIKTLNYRLMKKGATYFNRYHGFQIIDSLK